MTDFFNIKREIDTEDPTEVFFSEIPSQDLFKLGKYYISISKSIPNKDCQDICKLMDTIMDEYNAHHADWMSDHKLMMWTFHEIARRWTNSMLDSFTLESNGWKIKANILEKSFKVLTNQVESDILYTSSEKELQRNER